MPLRTVFLLLLLLMPLHASAQSYVVHPGDTLNVIAQRYHVALRALARINHIVDVNLVQVGRVLIIPVRVRTFHYRVRWGDTLLGLAARYRVDIRTIRLMNPSLGAYPLAGQLLTLCSPCSAGSMSRAPHPITVPGSTAPSAVERTYLVQPGDTLSGIALRYGVTPGIIMIANHLQDPDRILIGADLRIPSPGYNPWLARSLIVSYARTYGLAPSLPLAVGWQESGFNQTLVSHTGAIGVMQVEPYTGRHISDVLGRPFNLHALDDNIHAGVFWLSALLAYYGGNERLAVAAYYEGTRAVARYGLYADTVQYVDNVLALKSSFGG